MDSQKLDREMSAACGSLGSLTAFLPEADPVVTRMVHDLSRMALRTPSHAVHAARLVAALAGEVVRVLGERSALEHERLRAAIPGIADLYYGRGAGDGE